MTCVGQWSHTLGYDRNRNHPTSAQDGNEHKDIEVPDNNRFTEIKNLLVRSRNGRSYCIQYSHQEQKQPQNTTLNTKGLKSHQRLFKANIFHAGCHSLNYDRNVDSGNTLMHKTTKEISGVLSNTFTYKGPCQAALTDAASVSKANVSQISFNTKGNLNVILVVVINILMCILSSRVDFHVVFASTCS